MCVLQAVVEGDRRMTKRTLAIDDLYRIREAADPRLSPDGTQVAFVVTSIDREADENRSSIWIARDGEEPEPITHGKADLHPRFSPDGTTLAFLRRSDGPPQVWLLPLSGGESKKLTDLPLGAAGFDWSPDGSRLAVLAPTDLEGEATDDKEKERRKHAPVVVRDATYKADGQGLIGSVRVHLFVVDVSTGQAEALTKGDLNAATPAWSPDGKTITFAASTEDRHLTARTHLLSVGADGGEASEIAAWDGTSVAPFYSPDGSSVAFVGRPDAAPGHMRLYSVPRDGGTPSELFDTFDRNVMIGGPAYPGARPLFVDSETILFCARDRGCTNAYSWSGNEITKIAGDGERVVSGLSVGAGKITYVVSSHDIAADVFVADVDGTGERRVSDLNHELIDEVDLYPSVERTFEAPDGLEIHGWLISGDGPEPQPLLVDIHGGPHNAWNGVFDAVHVYHQVLAAQGWSILKLNPRGSDGYGEAFFTAVVGAWGKIDEDDFLSAVDDLVGDGLVDPNRLAVGGYSYGGHMTNWLTARTDRFKAAISGGCVTNITSFYGNSDMGWWMGAYEMGGEQYEARDLFTELSPLSYVEHVTAATLILHGENDDRCPVGQAEEWFMSLKRNGVTTEFVRYPGGSHLFILNGRPTHRIDYNERIVDWLRRYT
jgi:dipeptidyl aminopeptidase/acylaminoacyl peptidase